MITGGSSQGVGAIARNAAARNSRLLFVGSIPSKPPDDVTTDMSRSSEVQSSSGEGVSALETIAYWTDLLDHGLDPSEVTVLALGGREIAVIECVVALALGATVAVAGSDEAMMDERRWVQTGRLRKMPPRAEEIVRLIERR